MTTEEYQNTLGLDILCVILPNRWPNCVAYLNEHYSDVWSYEGTTLIADFGIPFRWEVLEKNGRILDFLPDIVDLSESLGDVLEDALDMLRKEIL